MKLHFVSAAFVFATGNACLAFSPNECASLLKFGIYDEHHILTDRMSYEKANSIICSDKASEVGIKVPIENIPVQGSGSFKENMCSQNSNSQYSEYHFTQIRKTINAGIVKAFDSCLSQKAPGVTYYLKTREDPKDFSVRFEYTPYADISKDTVDFLISGANCSSASINKEIRSGVNSKFQIGSSSFEFICERDPKKSVQITAHADRTNVNTPSIYLPAFEPQPEPPSSFTFYSPLVEDAALDMCATWGNGCEQGGIPGKQAATLWCHSINLGDATYVEVLYNSQPTRIITSKQLCNISECDRITKITCSVP